MLVIVILVAYLLGSIPFSYLVGRRRGVDVRRVGSGNIGASNVLRSAGVTAGLLALVLDVFKGALATSLALWRDPHGILPTLAAVTAVFGHIFPIWLRFRGGKGVASLVGAFFVLTPWPLLGSLACFTMVVALTRYVSVGSIVLAMALPCLIALSSEPRHVVVSSIAAALLIVIKHQSNIVRLVHGTENRLDLRQAQPRERRN